MWQIGGTYERLPRSDRRVATGPEPGGGARGTDVSGSVIHTGEPGRGGRVTIRSIAAEHGISELTVRRWFDRDYPTSGERTAGGRRRPAAAWAASLPTRRPGPGLSVLEAMEIIGVSKMTLHRWFDRDQPASGTVLDGRHGARTGAVERRCDPAWVQQMKDKREADLRKSLGLAL